MNTDLTCRVISVMVVILLIVALVLWYSHRAASQYFAAQSALHLPVKIALTVELGAFALLVLGCLGWLANRLRHQPDAPESALLRTLRNFVVHRAPPLPRALSAPHCATSINEADGSPLACSSINKEPPGSGSLLDGATKRRSVLVECSTQTSFDAPDAAAAIHELQIAHYPTQSTHRSQESLEGNPTAGNRISTERFNIYKHIFADADIIFVNRDCEEEGLIYPESRHLLSKQSSYDSCHQASEPSLHDEVYEEYAPVYAHTEPYCESVCSQPFDVCSNHSAEQLYFQFPSPTPSSQPDFIYHEHYPAQPTDTTADYYSSQLPDPFESQEEYDAGDEEDDTLEDHSPKYAKVFAEETPYDFEVSESELSEAMATTGAPPPPPPMPGTLGAVAMPNWREHPFPVRESAPSREQIEKQQYAHLPDKLLNAMSKDKKPFTYTPSGIGEKGVLDLTEIRSPRMKKRLMANLHSGDDEATTDEDSSRPGSSCSKPIQQQQQPAPKNLYQQPYAPCVLPPMDANNNRLRPSSPNPPPREKKEVRFAPSPILVSDDEELASKLEKRRLDVEARSKICTNQPESEPTLQPGAPPPGPIIQNYTPQSFPPPQQNTFNPPTAQHAQYQEPAQFYEEPEMTELVANASAAVQSARKMFSNQPYQTPASPVFDTSTPTTNGALHGSQYESSSESLPSPPPSAPFPPPAMQPQSQSVPPTPSSSSQPSVSVEQRSTPGEECSVNSGTNGAQTQHQETEEEMRQMISQIESELSEMRLKEQLQTQQLAGAQEVQEAQATPQQEKPSSGDRAQVSSPPTRTVEPEPNQLLEPLDAPSAFTPVTASTFHQPPAMQAYQQYQQPQAQQRAEPSYGGQKSQDRILQDLFNDMQDEIAKFEQISRETAQSSPAPAQAVAPTYGNTRTNDYGGFSTVQVARKGPCGAPPTPAKPVRTFGGPVGDGRTSCPPFQHEHLLDTSDGNLNYRCITPSMEIMQKTQTSNYSSSYNQNPRPFYRATTEEPSAYQTQEHEPLYRAQVVSIPTPAPAPGPAAPSPAQGRSRRQIPFAFKNQLPRPADDVAPEIVEERIASVQQQVAERELYAHQARNRAIKTTKNFVNQCSNQGYRESHTLPRTMHLAPQPPKHVPNSYDETDPKRAFSAERDTSSQLPPSPAAGQEPTPNSPTSPKMYYGSLPRKVKLNSRGQLAASPPPPPAPAKSYVNPEEGRQMLPNSGMFSQLPPVSSQQEPPPPRSRPMSQPTPGYTSSGRPYENKEEGRGYLGGGMFSQLPPGSQNAEPSRAQTNTNTSAKPYGIHEEARPFLPGKTMFSQLPPGSHTGGGEAPSRAPLYQTTPPGPQQVNAKSYIDKEEGRTYLSSSKMFSQLPPGVEPGTSNGSGPYSPPYLFGDPLENMKRQSSLPPPVSRGSTQIWTPPPTPPLPTPVNSPAYQQQQPKLSLQQIRRLPPSERPVEPTPSKYTGSHIPSRSFRLLQLITGEDIENQYANPEPQEAPVAPQPQRPASSMASYGRPHTKPPEPPVKANNVSHFHNQPNVSYSSLAQASDYGTDF